MLHAVRHVTVYVEGKGCGSMSQVHLHRLDIVPILQGKDCKAISFS